MPVHPVHEEYQGRLRLREAEMARFDRWDRRLGNARILVFALVLAAAWPTLVNEALSPSWLLAPLVAFAGLVLAHGPVVRGLGRLRLGVAFYRRGLARMTGDWSDPLDEGTGFQSGEHPYAEDLDIFGPGSLFALLCTARSLPGRGVLADWLSRGSFPEPRANPEVDRQVWFWSCVQTYLERDVRDLTQVADLGLFSR